MKIILPSFGFLNGLATAIWFSPLVLFLSAITLIHSKEIPFFFLLMTIVSRIQADRFFWGTMFKREMDRGENNKNWHLSIKQVVFSCSASVNAMIIMTIDICMDVLLIYMAFKASASSVIILLVYSVCQVVAPPLHGIIVRAFGKKNLLRFSMVITALATFAIFELNGVISHQYHLHWFSLGHFSTSTAALLILGAKCLLVGTTVIGKTTIAETISIETMYEASSG